MKHDRQGRDTDDSCSSTKPTEYEKYSTDSGERELRPFREEPEIHLYFNQHLVLHLDILHGFYALSTAGMSTTTAGQESSTG